jgi:hypothetical protein
VSCEISSTLQDFGPSLHLEHKVMLVLCSALVSHQAVQLQDWCSIAPRSALFPQAQQVTTR